MFKDFPRLASGKVDRKKLVADYCNSRLNDRLGDITYKDELEQQLCQAAQQSLSQQISPSSILSSAGMDSIASIRFASALRDAGFDVTAIDIMNSRTVSSLHAKIKRMKRDGERPGQRPSKVIELELREMADGGTTLSHLSDHIEAVVPCTPLQASMLSETISDPAAYCNWIELQLSTHYAVDAVKSWIHQIASDNEILRTGFSHQNGKFYQVIFKKLADEQVTQVDGIERTFQIQSEEEFLRPFRVHISGKSPDNMITVLIQLHHGLYDGWSMEMILSDLEALADSRSPPSRPRFREVLGYLNSEICSTQLDAAREFWADHLSGVEPITLPPFLPEISNTSEAVSMDFQLDLTPAYVVKTFRQLECSPQVLFQASLAWIWSRILGTNDVTVGSVTSGRTIPISGVENIIGPLISTMPIRTNVSQAKSVGDLLHSIQAANRGAISHGVLPLAEIKKVAGFRPGQSLYDVLFAYQESFIAKKEHQKIAEVAHQDYLETRLLLRS